MKLSSLALLEIVAVVQNGILEQRDVSQDLRDLDFEVKQNGGEEEVELSREFLSKRN